MHLQAAVLSVSQAIGFTPNFIAIAKVHFSSFYSAFLSNMIRSWFCLWVHWTNFPGASDCRRKSKWDFLQNVSFSLLKFMFSESFWYGTKAQGFVLPQHHIGTFRTKICCAKALGTCFDWCWRLINGLTTMAVCITWSRIMKEQKMNLILCRLKLNLL